MEPGNLLSRGTGQERSLPKPAAALIGWAGSARGRLLLALLLGGASNASHLHAQDDPKEDTGSPKLELQPSQLWADEPGEGFDADAQLASVSLGVNVGFARRGHNESHHLAIASFSYGQILGPVMGRGHWYQGNWELRGDLFAGGEFSPSTEWFVGLTPLLRYNFATGTRVVPFIGGGLGVTATSIGEPDLSGTFQFNERGGVGAHWFVRDDLAWTGELFFTHWSNGGFRHPNGGLNGFTCLVGLTFLY